MLYVVLNLRKWNWCQKVSQLHRIRCNIHPYKYLQQKECKSKWSYTFSDGCDTDFASLRSDR